MPRIASSSVVIPSQLSHPERNALCRALYEIQREVFDGVDYESFRSYVVESKAEQTWLLLHKNDSGELVGYLALHIFERRLAGTPIAVLRAAAASLRAYRGGNENAAFAVARVIGYRLKNPGKLFYYFGSLVHPSSYNLFATLHPCVWPRPGIETPHELLTLMSGLADEFGLSRVKASDPLLRKVGWKTRDSEAEREYWHRYQRPAARFFLERNPGYADGHGLVTVVPIALMPVLVIAAQLLRQQLQRCAQSALSFLQRVPLLGRLFRPTPQQLQQLLRTVPLFSNLTASGLTDVAAHAELVSLGAGQTIAREGEASDHLYLVVRGAVCVFRNKNGREQILDQLTTGDLFGEVALLTGELRTESIRTVKPTTLLRLDRPALFRLLSAHRAIEDALWQLCAQRRFERSVQEEARFQELERAERQQWFQQGSSVALHARESVALDSGEYLFLVDGAAEIERSGIWLSTSAPTLIEASRSLSVAARENSRAVRLPAPPMRASLQSRP